jgi:extradiol dioxygenase family protein
MGLLKIEGVTHWSIPVNNLEESEQFYGDLLGLKHLGRLGNSGMSCFNVGDHNILLCARSADVDKTHVEDQNVHHSFTVSPDTLEQACKIFQERQIRIDRLYYRAKGFFTGRELYFFDPSGNRLELRDPTWQAGMPEPSFEEIAARN